MMNLPVMLYDDRCLMCRRFARAVNALAGGRLTIIGHYSDEGRRIRQSILDEDATEMFWVLRGRAAYGGRAALLPLLYSILTAKKGLGMAPNGQPCLDGCSVFLRSYSLLRRSRRIAFDAPRRSV